MKSLDSYIVPEVEIDEQLQPLTEEENSMLLESLNEPHLLLIAKQLNDNIKAGTGNVSFGDIFGNMNIMWDKIGPSRVKEYDYPKDEKVLKMVRATLNGSGIVITISSEGTYTYAYKNGTGHGKDHISLNQSHSRYWKSISYTETMDRISWAHKLIIIDTSSAQGDLSTWNLKSERSASRANMIPTGVEYEKYCKELAKENNRRYKTIVDANKSKKDADFESVNKAVSDSMEKMMKCVVLFQKEPEKYADQKYALSIIMDHINDTKRYDKGKTIGSDGLLVLFKQYNDMYIELTAGKNGYYWNSPEKLKELGEKVKKAADDLQKNYFSRFGL